MFNISLLKKNKETIESQKVIQNLNTHIKRVRNFERAYVPFEDTVKDVDAILMPIINKSIGQKPTNKKVWSDIVEALTQLHLNKKLEIIFLEQYYFFYLDKINQLNEV